MTTVETATGPIEGADLGRVPMHEHVLVLSTETQQNYHDEWGSYLGMDRFGTDGYLPTAQRTAVVAELCHQGYAIAWFLATTPRVHIDWIAGEVPLGALPDWHYLHISHDVLPALLEHGVTSEQIDTMLVDNPRTFLESRSLGSY